MARGQSYSGTELLFGSRKRKNIEDFPTFEPFVPTMIIIDHPVSESFPRKFTATSSFISTAPVVICKTSPQDIANFEKQFGMKWPVEESNA